MRTIVLAFFLLLVFVIPSFASALPSAEDFAQLTEASRVAACNSAPRNDFARAAHMRASALIQAEEMEQAGDIIKELFRQQMACPNASTLAHALASANTMYITTLVQGDAPEAALPFLDIQRQAAAAFPDKDILGLLGRVLRLYAEAAGDDDIFAELHALVATHPRNELLGAEAAEAWCGKYATVLRNAKLEQAAPIYQRIIKQYERYPNNFTIRNSVAMAMFQTVVACWRNGWMAEGELWCARLAEFAGKHKEPKIVQVLYAHALKTLMEAFAQKGGAKGLSLMESSLSALEKLAKEYPDTPSFDSFFAQGLGLIIEAHVSAGQKDKAEKEVEQLAEVAKRRPKDLTIRESLDRARSFFPD